jgi:hypothetical protein
VIARELDHDSVLTTKLNKQDINKDPTLYIVQVIPVGIEPQYIQYMAQPQNKKAHKESANIALQVT